MKTQKTVLTCDICDNEVEYANEGVVRISKHQELRFDICEADTKNFFGKIEPSKRRGRVQEEA